MNQELSELVKLVEKEIEPQFKELDRICEKNNICIV